jgi:hypothetical protein
MTDAPRGFKLVTPENWLDPDPINELIVKLDQKDGSVSSVDGRDWIVYVNALALGRNVPQEVRIAYEFTVGAVGYAYFYYPLFTIVVQQLLRIADFSVSHLFAVRTDLPPARTFEHRLKVLRDAGYVSNTDFKRWDAIRNLRNIATHPDWQQTWGHSSLDIVRTIVEIISALPWPMREKPSVTSQGF